MKIKIKDLTQEQIKTICDSHKFCYGQCYGCPLLIDYPLTDYLVCVRKIKEVAVNIPKEYITKMDGKENEK